MAGENPDEPHTGAADEFLTRPKWDRFRILIAGPTMNIVLSLVLMTVVLAQGAQVPIYESDPVDVAVVTKGSPAESGGIRPGDRIIKVGSQRTRTWEDFFLAIGGRAERDVPDHAAARRPGNGRHGEARRRRRRCASATSACCRRCTRASGPSKPTGPPTGPA